MPANSTSPDVRRVPWTQRVFRFDGPAGAYPELIERLRGTPARLEDRARGVASAILTRREGGHWSAQENIGHLLDLEALFVGRLDDFERGEATLRAWDTTNRATDEARHNERPIADILAAFRSERGAVVRRLDGLSPEWFARTSLHPRLQVPMRLVDLLDFTAQHDDYHLATISELLRRPPA